MKYKLILTRKDGRFSNSLTFDTLQEAEKFGYNHTNLENMFCNYIPVKNERLFRVYEINNTFDILKCV